MLLPNFEHEKCRWKKLWCRKKIADFINHHYPKVAYISYQDNCFQVNQLLIVIFGRPNQPHSIKSIDFFCINCLLKVLYYITCLVTWLYPVFPKFSLPANKTLINMINWNQRHCISWPLQQKWPLTVKKDSFSRALFYATKAKIETKKSSRGELPSWITISQIKKTKFRRTSLYIYFYLTMNFTLNNPLHQKGMHYAK